MPSQSPKRGRLLLRGQRRLTSRSKPSETGMDVSSVGWPVSWTLSYNDNEL